MASKLTRYTALLFGSGAGTNQMAEFGSLAAGTPDRFNGSTITPTIIQSLSNFLNGWFDAVVDGNAIAMEDLNSICYLFAYQVAYLMQAGVAEYDASTEYFIGSLCSSGGLLFVSLTDNNIGNALTSSANWSSQGGNFRTTTANEVIGQNDSFIRMNTTGGSFTETLPAVASTPLGKRFIIKNVGSAGNFGTLKGNSAELIDGSNTLILNSTPVLDSVTVSNNGTGWDII